MCKINFQTCPAQPPCTLPPHGTRPLPAIGTGAMTPPWHGAAVTVTGQGAMDGATACGGAKPEEWGHGWGVGIWKQVVTPEKEEQLQLTMVFWWDSTVLSW